MWSPRDHFEKEVRPTCDAYMRDATSSWKAKAAAQAINNFVEWTFIYYETHDPIKTKGAKSARDYRKLIAQECPTFQVIWDIAEAAKHRFLTMDLAMRVVETSTGGWAETLETLEIVNTGQEFDSLIGCVIRFWDERI